MNLEQIDTSTTAGKAEVMRLAAEGRRVCVRVRDSDPWCEVWESSEPSWNWASVKYAIRADLAGEVKP